MANEVGEMVLGCSNLADLDALALEVLSFAGDTKIWLIEGEMGAGKTTFVKSVCRVLEVEDTVSSPTFPIINEYYSAKGPVYHFDFYRIKDLEEAAQTGCEDYFYSNEYCFIEWSEIIKPLLPDNGLVVQITIKPDNTRELQLKKYG